ncbi:MAG: hypothetical protein HY818_16020 [Acetobacterium woodii]|nr:hypothetical protein [Acetobacterium woodii]
MKKTAVKILSALLMLSMVFSSNVFAAEKTNSAWDSFVGLFGGNVTTAADTQVDGVTYRTHVQNEGWAQGWVSDGATSGTVGKGLRLEGLEVKIDNTKLPAGLGITYQTQIENEGWAQGWVSDGAMSGSEGKGLRLEGVQIKLTGANAGDYSVGYKTQIQNKGWETDWSYNGDTSGTVGEGLRLEAIQIEIFRNIPDLTAYDAALAAVTQADYTAASWTAYQAVVNANVVTTDNLVSEVATATANITAAQANLILAPKVVSVTAINATQLQVVFNSDIDPASVLADVTVPTTLKSGLVATVTPVGTSTPNVFKSAAINGKTVTLTYTTALNGRNVVVLDAFKTTTGLVVPKYDEVLTFTADKVAPTIVSTVKVSAAQFKVNFSEPINSLGSVSFKLADGTVVASGGTGVTTAFTAGDDYATFSLGTSIAVNKTVTATFIGTSDAAGNLITPNPATASFTKGDKDGVVPTIASVTQTGAKTYAVKFSTEIIAAPTMTITGNAWVSTVKSTTDATVYNVTVTNALDGLTTITFGTFDNLSGETAASQTKVVSFTKDTVAPKVISSAVVSDVDNGKQYLELTFDKNVVLTTAQIASSTTGSFVKDFVTTPITTVTNTPLTFKTSTVKTVVRAELATLLTGKDNATAVYTLALQLNGVASEAGVAFVNPTSVTFTRGTDGSGTNTTVLGAPTITQGSDNNKVNVQFPAAVDGASATTVANYSVGGATIESVTLQPVSGGTQTVVLNLVAGSNTFTGVRNISVANVKALGSTVTMVPYSINSLSLNENIKPTVTSAKVASVTPATALIPAVPATTSAVTPGGTNTATGTVTVSGTYTGITDKTITLQKTATGYSFGGADMLTTEGLTFNVGSVVSPATGDTWSVNVTAAIAEVPATTGTTLVTVTYSEPVVVTASTNYTVNVGGVALVGTTGSVTANATPSTTVTVTINKELTAANFTSGVTLTSTDYKIADVVGNIADIGTGGIAVTLN